MCLDKNAFLGKQTCVHPPLGFSSFYLGHFPLTAKLQLSHKAPQFLTRLASFSTITGSLHIPVPLSGFSFGLLFVSLSPSVGSFLFSGFSC